MSNPTTKVTSIMVNLIIRWCGQEEVVEFPQHSTTKDLSERVLGRLQIPIHVQKYFVPKYGWIKMKDVKEHVLLQPFDGKKLMLLGTPNPQIRGLRNARRVAKAQHKQNNFFERTFNRLIRELLAKLKHTFEIAGTQTAGQLDPEELEDVEDIVEVSSLRRCFGRLAKKTHWTTKNHLELLIGTGCVPRLRCTHIPGGNEPRACHRCEDIFIMEWYLFVSLNVKYELFKVNHLVRWRPIPEHAQALQEMRQRAEAFHKEWNHGIARDECDATLHEIAWMIDELEVDAIMAPDSQQWLANDHSDGCKDDLESFYDIFDILSGLDD